MSTQSIAALPIHVEGLALIGEIALTVPAPSSQEQLEALSWFISQGPDDTIAAIQRAHEDHCYWQQRDAQAALDGGW